MSRIKPDQRIPAVHLLLDVSHTSHTRARTGVQRVVRELHGALGTRATTVCFDPYLGSWRTLRSWEQSTLLSPTTVGNKRSAQWPLLWKLRARLRSSRRPQPLPVNDGLLVPEVFSSAVAKAWPALFEQVRGPKVAIFHDALPLKFPEVTAPSTVARFPYYLRDLQLFDGVIAVSEDSRRSLEDFWKWAGASRTPATIAIPHGLNLERVNRADPLNTRERPQVLTVGAIEGRKNTIALLEACERLWKEGLVFDLKMVGPVSRPTGLPALQRIRKLEKAKRPLSYAGAVTDALLERAYNECSFTVYPSLAEGFGLPVMESLAHGKPCICSARGALGEISRGGGCLPLENVDIDTLADAIRRLLQNQDELEALKRAARSRTFKSWADYTLELTEWIHAIARR